MALVEIKNLNVQVEVEKRDLKPQEFIDMTINTKKIKYIYKKIRELTEEDKKIIDISKYKTAFFYYYKIYFDDDTVAFVDYSDYNKIYLKEMS